MTAPMSDDGRHPRRRAPPLRSLLPRALRRQPRRRRLLASACSATWPPRCASCTDGDEGLFASYSDVQFRAPVRAGDVLEITAELVRVGTRSRVMAFAVHVVARGEADRRTARARRRCSTSRSSPPRRPARSSYPRRPQPVETPPACRRTTRRKRPFGHAKFFGRTEPRPDLRFRAFSQVTGGLTATPASERGFLGPPQQFADVARHPTWRGRRGCGTSDPVRPVRGCQPRPRGRMRKEPGSRRQLPRAQQPAGVRVGPKPRLLPCRFARGAATGVGCRYLARDVRIAASPWSPAWLGRGAFEPVGLAVLLPLAVAGLVLAVRGLRRPVGPGSRAALRHRLPATSCWSGCASVGIGRLAGALAARVGLLRRPRASADRGALRLPRVAALVGPWPGSAIEVLARQLAVERHALGPARASPPSTRRGAGGCRGSAPTGVTLLVALIGTTLAWLVLRGPAGDGRSSPASPWLAGRRRVLRACAWCRSTGRRAAPRASRSSRATSPATGPTSCSTATARSPATT